MKTHKYMILGLTLVLMAIFSPTSVKADIGTDLRYGSHGAEVTELQEFLIDKGFLPGQATGNFFTLTRKAVVAYQTSVQLPATGFVGPMTRGKINEELALGTSPEETQSVAVVTPSTDTSVLQAKLNDLIAQLAQMQAETKAQAIAQQTKTDQQTQLFGQIAQNTTPVVAPVVTPAPVVVPEVKKELTIVGTDYYPFVPVQEYIEFEVKYLEDGKSKTGTTVSLSSINSIVANATQPTSSGCKNAGICAYIRYSVNRDTSDTITFSANGLSKSYTFSSSTMNVLPINRIDTVGK